MHSEEVSTIAAGSRLRRKLAFCSGAIHERILRIFNPKELPCRYPLLLRSLLHVSRGGDSLLAFAADQAHARGQACDRRLVEYLERHRREELGHFEWILDDLEVLGFPRVVEEARLPSVETIALMGCGYPWIEREPLTVLGVLAVYEGDPLSIPFIEEAISASELPAEAFRFYLDHARLDQAHGTEIYNLIDELITEPFLEEVVGLCALHHLTLTERLADSILRAPTAPTHQLF